jgi:hypothetical protein
MGPFGLLFGLLALMFWFGVLGLLVLAGMWLFHQLRDRQTPASTPVRTTCTRCSHLVQPNWRHCPHCGQPLAHAHVDNLTLKARLRQRIYMVERHC